MAQVPTLGFDKTYNFTKAPSKSLITLNFSACAYQP